MAKTKGKMTEDRVVSYSFITNFYQQVQQLKHFSASYNNLLVVIDNKYKDVKNMPEQEKADMANFLNNIRYYARLCYDDYLVLVRHKVFKADDSELIDDLHKELTSNFIVDREKISEFVREFNFVLTKDIMKDLLQSAEDVVGNVFSDGEAKKQ